MDQDYASEGGFGPAAGFVVLELVSLWTTAGVRFVVNRAREGRRPSRRTLAACAVVVAMAAAGAVAFAAAHRGGQQTSGDTAAERRGSQQAAARLTSAARRLHLRGRISFSVPADSTHVWVVTMNADGSGLRRIVPRGHAALRVDGFAGSPDGSRMAFWVGDDVYTMRRDGSRVTRIAHLVTSSDLAWSPHGDRVAYGRRSDCPNVNGEVVAGCLVNGDGIYVANADGGGAHIVAPSNDGTNRPGWSPDGKHIAFSRQIDDSPGLAIVGSDGTDLHPLTWGGVVDGDRQPQWSPDGRAIATNCGAFLGGSLCVMRPDGTQRRRLASLNIVDLAWSPDGRWIAFLALGNEQESRDGIWVIRRDGARLTQVLPRAVYVRNTGWLFPSEMSTELVWMRR
jgi:dipeptidyl aminopeptidase/acylaminoacyl peptidase